jgi:hypothetical protein
MSIEKKPTVEEVLKRVENLSKLVKNYREDFEDRMKKKPMESAGIIFVAGLILGIILGTSTSRR